MAKSCYALFYDDNHFSYCWLVIVVVKIISHQYHHHHHCSLCKINISYFDIFPVGAPIKVPKIQNPSEEEINQYHTEYIKGLENIFENHKTKHGIPEDVHLEIC